MRMNKKCLSKDGSVPGEFTRPHESFVTLVAFGIDVHLLQMQGEVECL